MFEPMWGAMETRWKLVDVVVGAAATRTRPSRGGSLALAASMENLREDARRNLATWYGGRGGTDSGERQRLGRLRENERHTLTCRHKKGTKETDPFNRVLMKEGSRNFF